MGKCRDKCSCFSCFRAVFRPNASEDMNMGNLPKPPEVSNTADEMDGVPYIDSTDGDILIIRSVDPCINTNGQLHHTSRFEMMTREIEPQLIVRRGQPFRLDIALSRPYNPEKDGISFIFTVDDEDKPNYGHGTLVAIPLLKKPDKSLSWNAILESHTQDSIVVEITPSPRCIVARWKMEIDTKIIDNGAYSYSCGTKVYILYNPWCKNDQVYQKAEDWREECILADVGLIWRGSYNRLRPCIWKYAQFEKDILDCSLYLVHVVGKISARARGDPVKTTRALAAAVNSADDNGCIMGNWSEDFDGGTPPTKWVGSMEILQQYYSKKKPVKYGQCWVFSGVLTTICRAIGIPARTITNYSSAHDTQSSLTVDYFVNEKGGVMEELNADSIWNFHVWNEVWMERPDLGKECNGWQVIDSTPQELSEDIYRCGPSSVAACKQGEVLRPYDGAFLFAEVNADKVFWRYTGPTQPLKLLRKDTNGIGQLVSTKAAGKWVREDITSSYKHSEKTEEERTTMLKALRQSENLFSRYYLNEDFNDIYFNFEMRDDIKIGQPFTVAMQMRNRSKSRDYKVKVVLRVDVVLYTGKVKHPIKLEESNVTIRAETMEEVKLDVTYVEYYKKLLDQCAFNIACLATVEDTKFEYFAEDDFRVRKPDIKFELQGKAKQDQEITVDVNLENPLPIPIKKGEFIIEGPGLEKQVKIKVKTVQPGEKAVGQFTLKPPLPGRQTIAAKFVSKEMNDVDGFINFMVELTDKGESNGNNV